MVCSRLNEYESCQERLELNGSICLKELRDEQIAAYLRDVGRPELWQSISAHPDLLTLLRAPLLLSITVLAYPTGADQQWQQLQTTHDQLQYLLDAYVERMMQRQFKSRAYGNGKVPTPRQTQYWLVWLARQMQQQSQTEFLIEELQPSMLSRQGQFHYSLMIRLSLGLFGGLLCGLLCGLSFGGLACIQHFVLRLFLYQARVVPWNYARFLNYSTERLLLQRVGGRYRFMHKLLQDHFAAMEIPLTKGHL